jgi:hypothetical protein
MGLQIRPELRADQSLPASAGDEPAKACARAGCTSAAQAPRGNRAVVGQTAVSSMFRSGRRSRPATRRLRTLGNYDQSQRQDGGRVVRRRGRPRIGALRYWLSRRVADQRDGPCADCGSAAPATGRWRRRAGATRRRRRLHPRPELWAHSSQPPAAPEAPPETGARFAARCRRPADSVATFSSPAAARRDSASMIR